MEFVKKLTVSLSKVRDFSFTLDCAETLNSAFTIAKDKKFDIILLDLFLPENQGLQTLKKVKIRLPSLPIIILAENDDVEIAVSAVRFGAQDYLIKRKIDPRLLSLAIRYAVERKKTEQFQREQLHFLQSVMDNIPNPLYIKDSDLFYGACNSAFEDLIGESKENIIGKTVFDIIDGESSELIRKKELELLSGENTLVYELQLPHSSGLNIDMIFHETLHKRSDGSVAGLIGVATDVSRMKKIEQSLKNAKSSLEKKVLERTAEIRKINNKLRKQVKKRKNLEKQLIRERKIFVNGPVVVFRCSADFTAAVEYVSPNIKQFGYSVDDFIVKKMKYSEIVSFNHRKRIVRKINDCIRAGRDNIDLYFDVIKKDRTYRNVYCSVVIGKKRSAEVTHFDGYILDITDWEEHGKN